ncbi:6-phosphogluconolactonase [Fictibacillus fluitans]|uniref:6-phosphogluconolactonase n=1 Tax=Fictibacillus fluitans TaxID=3058422 RepID=A0ABT8I290_9BACL|nr:6-phosphogluconolactonase [Fictibacillus sp. NE201]MDN4527152.1 6-phosphogluconolactonase [Fictibacillus sp. NE201]
MLKIFEKEEEVAEAIANVMAASLKEDYPLFCLASGSTPQKSYQRFALQAKHTDNVRKLRIVSLDEWVGIEKESEGSCYQMLQRDLFSPAGIEPDQILFYDGMSDDLQQECEKIDAYIKEHPITFSLMGVGMNGHIGLNEPGTPLLDHSSVVDLSNETKTTAQKYFEEPATLTKGITLGLNQVIASKKVIVAITGRHKADIVKEIFNRPEAGLPAQELLHHDHIDFYLDTEAAKHITQKVEG